jgi:LCP family protein required for cell wall assembly
MDVDNQKPPLGLPKKRRGNLFPLIIKVGFTIAIPFVIGWAAFTISQNASLILTSSINPIPGISIKPSQTSLPGDIGIPLTDTLATPTALAEIAPSLKPWDGASRVTILVLGLDYRDWESNSGPSRSDTMILLTLDPLSNTAGILSIPRDMWASIPGFKNGKINTAYYLGDLYKMPGGGPALAVKTVEELIGVPINYFAQIDFSAFVRFIDDIEGVAIDVPEPITIDLLGGGPKTKKKLEPGRQVLPGEWALAYARARHTEGGDFDRAARQQQVIMAIRDRMLEPNMLPTIISKAPTLYNDLASGIRTNLTLDQVIQLALLAQSVPDENIQRGVIGEDSVVFAKSPDGLDILIPVPDKIMLLRDKIFAGSGGLSPETAGSPGERMQLEGAKIALYNGTQNAALLDRTADYFRGLGVTILQTGPASQSYTLTNIIDHTGNPYTMGFLVDLMHISNYKILIQFDPNSQIDVEVFLGLDWARQNPLP